MSAAGCPIILYRSYDNIPTMTEYVGIGNDQQEGMIVALEKKC